MCAGVNVSILEIIKEYNLGKMVLGGNFGLEKENLRVNKNGELALTPHPSIFGDKALHPFITTDFAESQVEMVTPPCESPTQALDFIEMLHDLISLELDEEYLWPYSLPPELPADDSLIKEAQFNDPEITEYREYLTHKYGKKKQLLSGVHYNFSFSNNFLELLYKLAKENLSFREFTDQIYLKLARYYLKYSWLFIYLTGANSIVHKSYSKIDEADCELINNDFYQFNGARSYRNGANGYRNNEYFYVSYNSLAEYIQDVDSAIEKGYITAAKEYYSQLRLKGTTKKNTLSDLHDNGISYIEIRTLDLNPLNKIGITLESLELIHLFLIYALIAPDFHMSHDEYCLANKNQILAATGSQDGAPIINLNCQEKLDADLWAMNILNDIKTSLLDIGIAEDKLTVLDYFNNKLASKSPSYAQILQDSIKDTGYTNLFMKYTYAYFDDTKSEYYKLHGFDDLEMSTQILLKEAIKRGVNFNFINRYENFIEFRSQGTSCLVKQATKTGVDNFATIMVMDDKLLTKKLLSKAGIFTPDGNSYTNIEQALIDYPIYSNTAIIIKPNVSHLGVGVSLLKSDFKIEEYRQALILAFSFNGQIIIEDYFQGNEYRFFVIDGESAAILSREPANVIGDGQSTIRQLVDKKNQDPLRGVGYKMPLEKISFGAIETRHLALQNLTVDSIIEDKNKIYLRKNSNISTGGDSIDYTDLIPNSYKRVAAMAANAIGARICGVDMIIKNINNPYTENNYAVIELTSNPAIHIHTYPYQGQDRDLATRILKLLKLV